MWFLNTSRHLDSSHNTDLVGNVEGILFGWENDVSLLETVWSDQGVHWLDLDAIKFLASFLDHWLVSSSVHDENQCVVIFNGLDGTFSGKRVLDDGVLVPGLFLLYDLSFILGSSGLSQGLWSSECDFGPGSVPSLCVSSLLHGGCGLLGLLKIWISEGRITGCFDIRFLFIK